MNQSQALISVSRIVLTLAAPFSHDFSSMYPCTDEKNGVLVTGLASGKVEAWPLDPSKDAVLPGIVEHRQLLEEKDSSRGKPSFYCREVCQAVTQSCAFSFRMCFTRLLPFSGSVASYDTLFLSFVTSLRRE